MIVLLLLACTSDPPADTAGGSAGPRPDTHTVDSQGTESAGDTALDSGRDSAVDTATDTGPREEPLDRADVVVIGAGGSGMAAAVAALDAGADVLVLERSTRAGGASSHAGNHWAAGTRWQAEAGVTDSAELALSEWDGFTGGDSSAVAVRSFVEESADTLEWLESLGCTFVLGGGIAADTGSVQRLHIPGQDAGIPVNQLMLATDGLVRVSTTATGLVVEGGRVVGVDVGPGSDGSGGSGWVAAEAVIVATGGFARNDVRVAAAVPGIDNFPKYYEAYPGMDGNGLDMMEAAGAATANLENFGLYAHAAEDAQIGAPEVMVITGLESALVVDSDGRRVADEREFMSSVMGTRFLTEGPFFAIYDATAWATVNFSGRGFNYEGASQSLNIDGATYAGLVSLPEGEDAAGLAAAAGFDAATFSTTVSAYNEAVASGSDAEYGKPVEYLRAVSAPPLVALPVVLGRSKSFGGAALDDQGRVVDDGGNVIPGLYAAGEAAGFLGGTWMGHGFNGTVTAAYWSGRRAGATAAADVAAR